MYSYHETLKTQIGHIHIHRKDTLTLTHSLIHSFTHSLICLFTHFQCNDFQGVASKPRVQACVPRAGSCYSMSPRKSVRIFQVAGKPKCALLIHMFSSSTILSWAVPAATRSIALTWNTISMEFAVVWHLLARERNASLVRWTSVPDSSSFWSRRFWTSWTYPWSMNQPNWTSWTSFWWARMVRLFMIKLFIVSGKIGISFDCRCWCSYVLFLDSQARHSDVQVEM